MVNRDGQYTNFFICPTKWCSWFEAPKLIARHVLAEVGIVAMTAGWATLPQVIHTILELCTCSNHQGITLLFSPVRVLIVWVIKLYFIMSVCVMMVCTWIPQILVHFSGMTCDIWENVLNMYQ